MEADLSRWGGFFDIVFMGGLHYFHDLPAFMGRMEALLQPGGRMICSDFHPFQKVADILGFQTPAMDYFSTAIVEGEMVHARVYPPGDTSGLPQMPPAPIHPQRDHQRCAGGGSPHPAVRRASRLDGFPAAGGIHPFGGQTVKEQVGDPPAERTAAFTAALGRL